MGNIGIKRENDRIFRNGSFPDMRSETVAELAELPEISREVPYRVEDNTVRQTTVQAILDNADSGKVIALNFANAMYPGGGYVLGGNAQEESLCRASLLYYTIKTQKRYYRKNRLHVLPNYTDIMIYSENVPVIRDDSGAKLEDPLTCAFITCPAVNRTFAKFMMRGKKIDRIMRTRIKRIINLAVMKEPDVIVLGAFGCGMFGNKREKVLPVFEEMINLYIPDKIKVIFAIP
ncbi:MAG: TIGR02452 family protein [Ruminococcus sp.]|nr:TIGR02452 family protein [Ruminococcus sp.]